MLLVNSRAGGLGRDMHYRPAGDVCVMVTPCRSYMYMQIMLTTAMLVSEAIAGENTTCPQSIREMITLYVYVGARR